MDRKRRKTEIEQERKVDEKKVVQKINLAATQRGRDRQRTELQNLSTLKQKSIDREKDRYTQKSRDEEKHRRT